MAIGLHPKFESVVEEPQPPEEKKERLPFDKFVEQAACEVLAALPFVEAWEPALPQEDRAGADGFLKLKGIENPLAIDVTVSESPNEVKKKLSRIGEIYASKVDRPDARIRADRLAPIRMTVLFLQREDFANLYNMYAASPSSEVWRLPPEIQRAVFQEFVTAIRRFFDRRYPGNPALAERQFRNVIAEWMDLIGHGQSPLPTQPSRPRA